MDARGDVKRMPVGATHAGAMLWINQAKIVLDEAGAGLFPVKEGQISIYVNERIAGKLQKMVNRKK